LVDVLVSPRELQKAVQEEAMPSKLIASPAKERLDVSREW
jgi:hypothetical protein